MKRFVQGDNRTQSFLLPEALDDYVTDTNPVRVVDVFVDELDLQKLGFDGVERKMTDDRYINRLLQFVSEQVGKHGSGGVLQANLGELGAKLSAIDGLANKGVHASVSTAEVEVCIVQTYLVIGEILRVHSDVPGAEIP